MTEQGEWIECVVDNNYEIWNQEPFPIRRKGTDRIIKESRKDTGYVQCHLSNKTYNKHRIIALQFLDNDDPEHKTQIDHINHDRADNRLSNLRWVSASENNMNLTGHGHKYVFFDELPETAEPLDTYNGHKLNNVFIDYTNEKLYLFNGKLYREAMPRHYSTIVYWVKGLDNSCVILSHKVLFVSD